MKKFLFALLIVMLAPVVAMAAQAGKITGLKGTVQVREKSNIPYKALKKGRVIHEGYWIKTGRNGWVELTLTDNSKFRLANNTEFEVTSFMVAKGRRRGSFNLAQGKLRASVVKLGGTRSSLTVRSGTAVAGIKGTEFLMLTEGQANVFFGNQGTVGVSGDGKGVEQPLTADTMTQNTRGITPVEPLKVEAGTPIAEARGIFDKVTAAEPPAEWTDSGRIADIIARWNINHGHYLADSGKYTDALHVFQISLDLTKVAEIRADAHMERGAVYARFLSNPELAMAEYLLVMEEYPKLPQAETALFNVAQTLTEMGFNEQARIRFEQYLKMYPDGKHRSNAETLLNSLGK
ncbi:MAG TPA: FecR domain-containing protein [Deltaproteobacteria bacterium]|nr:FecR domain-containing protein [Deltaproteobacteria bacterium]HQB38969.1 FecR domain-containing protein [Deltaproteobacteria bacterium]